MYKINTIVFDFDGVIVDTNRVKYDAFFQIFSQNKKAKPIVIKTLKTHREKSRYFIIKQILLELHKVEKTENDELETEILHYTEKYNTIVEKGAIECSEIRGARESLEVLSKQFPLYINSTTPIESLKRIILRRGLKPFFKNIYGYPKSKYENLNDIQKKEAINENKILVVGDGISDLEVAKKTTCEFIGIRNEFNRFNGNNFITLNDLQNLPDIITLRYSTIRD